MESRESCAQAPPVRDGVPLALAVRRPKVVSLSAGLARAWLRSSRSRHPESESAHPSGRWRRPRPEHHSARDDVRGDGGLLLHDRAVLNRTGDPSMKSRPRQTLQSASWISALKPRNPIAVQETRASTSPMTQASFFCCARHVRHLNGRTGARRSRAPSRAPRSAGCAARLA